MHYLLYTVWDPCNANSIHITIFVYAYVCTYIRTYMCAHTYMCTVCTHVTLITRKCTNIVHVYCVCVFKSSSQDTTDDHKWIICDGPVDALWIENMNTVLDDNKMLCLANSERIKLNNTMHMVFEVQDLAVASPATVSRYSYSQAHTEAVWGSNLEYTVGS